MEQQKVIKIEYRPAIVNKASIDAIFQICQTHKGVKKGEALGLYLFYYYTGIWQKTNSVKATVSYAAEGTGFSAEKIRKIKKALIQCGLIQDIIQKDKKGVITGHFIHVNMYANENTVMKELHKNTTLRKNHSVAKHESNAYIDNNKMLIYKESKDSLHMRVPRTTRKPSLDIDVKESFELKAAKRLKAAIESKGKMSRKVLLKTWTKQFRLLKERHNIDNKRIKKVIKWYIHHLTDEYVPQLYKIGDLQEKFFRIEDAMNRNVNGVNAKDNRIVVSAEVQKMTKDLKEHPHFGEAYTKVNENELSECIQTSLTNYIEHIKKHKKHLNKLSKQATTVSDKSYLLFVNYMSKDDLLNPTYFIECLWFRDIVFNQIKNWKEWSGNLKPYTFSIDNKIYDNYGRMESMRYGGYADDWERYITEMKSI